MASVWRPKMTARCVWASRTLLAPTSVTVQGHLPICFNSPSRAMLQAAFRSTATRSVAYRSVRCMASKPPRRPANPPPPPPPRAPSASEIPAEAPQPIPSSQIVPSLDFDPSAEDAKQERTGARSSKDSLSSIERRRRFLGRVSLAMLLVGAGVATWQMGAPLDEDELRARRWVRTG